MSKVTVPVGYKNTEVGVIPEDWEVKELGQIFELKSGETITSKNISSDDFFPCYGGNGLRGYTSTFNRNGEHVLIGRQGALCGNIEYVNDKFFASEHALVVTTIKNHSYKWLAYVLDRMHLNQYSESSAQPGLSALKLKKLKISLPSQQEQTAIATALSDVDNLIQSLEILISKKEAIKTATMQQLLTGKTRLPEFATREDGSKKGFKQTDLGQIPEDWELLSVRETCDLLTGFPFPSSKYQESGIKLLRGSNVKRGNTDWSDNITKFWTESTSSIEQYLLQKSDIVISMDGSLVGRSFAQLSDSDLPALLLQRVARLRARLISQNYLKEWICSPIFSDYCDSVKTVTAIPHISPADILNFRLFIPQNKKEQTAIATILSDMDAEIQALHTRLTKTQNIKQGMMQQLLTGKVRLVHPSDSQNNYLSADKGELLV